VHQGHDAVSAVYYLGLPSNPQHAIAKVQIPGGFGGMLSFALHRD
jgi:cystathionine beta-lyase/cystathionine gamma-synthase